MPRAFLVKPRPLEQVPVTSDSSHDVRPTSLVDASSWLPVDCDVNNNSVNRSSSVFFRPSGLDLTMLRPTDDIARWPFDVAGGLHWWSRSAAAAAVQPSTLSWQDARVGQSHDVKSSTKRSRSPSTSSAAAAAESGTAADEDTQHLWWSYSPHSDVSASGIKSLLTFATVIDY